MSFFSQVQQMFYDLIRFAELFGVMCIGFAVALAILFGSKTEEYRFGVNFFTMYRLLINDAGSNPLTDANSWIGAIVFVLFTGTE